jgi:hypothetical protein
MKKMSRYHSFIELYKGDLCYLQGSGKLSIRKLKQVPTLLSTHEKIELKEIVRVIGPSGAVHINYA